MIVGLFHFPPKFIQNSQSQTSGEGKMPLLFHWWFLAFGIYYVIAAQGLVNNPTNLNLANPAAAALTSYSLIRIAAWIHRFVGVRKSLAFITVILLMVGGLGQQALHSFAFHPWAEDDYKLGLALRQVSQPEELVITAASTPGDPVSIYYSQRRGWVFPPVYVWSSHFNLEDEHGIRLLNELVSKGASWFGIVNQQKFVSEHPKLSAYIDQNFNRYKESSKFVIYRVRF